MRGPRIAVANGSIHEPRLRIDDSAPRMTDPIVTSADGAPVRQNHSMPNMTPARQRNFATLDDLRAFVDGRMEAVTSSPRNR
jgi:hypothetical protein